MAVRKKIDIFSVEYLLRKSNPPAIRVISCDMAAMSGEQVTAPAITASKIQSGDGGGRQQIGRHVYKMSAWHEEKGHFGLAPDIGRLLTSAVPPLSGNRQTARSRAVCLFVENVLMNQ